MNRNKMLPKWLRDLLNAIIMPNKKCGPIIRTHRKMGRNEPCRCGSKIKYKHCCYDENYWKGNV